VHGIAEEWQVISRVELLRDKIAQWESRCFTRRRVYSNRTTPNPMRRTAKRTVSGLNTLFSIPIAQECTVGNSATRPVIKLRYLTQKKLAGLIGQYKT
jgi:hypothetical protein